MAISISSKRRRRFLPPPERGGSPRRFFMNVLLVTVNCLDHSVDLGLPADLPIGRFLPMLLEVCGLAPSGTPDSDEEWELVPFGGDVLPIAASLERCGVLDGARLVLRVAASTEIEVSERQSGRAYMPAYPSINADPGAPIVNWIRDDLFTE